MPQAYFGTMDAAKAGMGGVWFPPIRPEPLSIHYPASQQLHRPILRRARFPQHIQSKLVSCDNRLGTITNSDLELAGSIAHDDMLAQALPSQVHLSTCLFSDNTPAVAWKTRGSTSATGLAAYLLQQSALHQRYYPYRNKLNFLPGHLNVMADDCSHLWNLSDEQLLTHFYLNYPQCTLWQMHHLRPVMHSALTTSLLMKRSQPGLYLPDLRRHSKPGQSGLHFLH